MRFFAPLIAACAALAAAQSSDSQYNKISIPNGGLQISVGETTIKWTNPTSGTVTIKLQQGADVTPDSGYTLASGVNAAAGTATFNIPSGVNSHDYSFEIIDEQDPSVYNFSTQFSIAGATGSGLSSSGASSSAPTSSAAVSSAASSSAAATTTSSASVASSSAASSSSSASSTTGASSTSGAASTSSSSESFPTSVTGGASALSVQGGVAALIAAAVLVL